ASNKLFAVRRESDTVDPSHNLRVNQARWLPILRPPHAQKAVSPTGSEALAVGRKRHSAHPKGMSLKRLMFSLTRHINDMYCSVFTRGGDHGLVLRERYRMD